MAAPMCLTKFRGQLINISGRLFPLQINSNCRFVFTNSDDYILDYDIDEEELEKKLAKIRDCSGLTRPQKMKHYGKMPGLEVIFKNGYKGKKRNKLRRLYAEYGHESGINPGIMFPSKPELNDLWDIEKNWTKSFQEIKEDLENKKAAEIEADRLRYEKIEKAMAGMNGLLKNHINKQKKSEEDQRKRDKTEELLDEFKLQYGFNATPDSKQFKQFKRIKSEELKDMKAKQKKEEKKASSFQRLKQDLENEVKSKLEN
ncbi:large ribosomal subunit protein mL64-like [Ruditapes philippinarum]|uniref:large ribosomal subunit protein mL64-like n=1 Tax=Ruditapes philippinarum TaxID=129788 RepID=UPI00295C2D94|nr:large ribosomal subunit protein mL64-like [Ruditapes philippinarum]